MRPVEKRTYNTYYTPKEGAISYYLSDISKYKIISDEETKKLLKKAKKGDKKSLTDIINSNQRFVFSVAKKFCNGDYTLLPDLVNEANMGLVMSVEKFDMCSNNKFLTYAVYWMQRQIYLYLTFINPIVKTSNKSKTNKVSEIKNKFMMINGRQPTPDEIMIELKDKFGIELTNESDIYSMISTSIDSPMITENYDDFSSFYSDNRNENSNNSSVSDANIYDNETECDYSKTLISNSIGVLTDKERKVVELLYGINDFREYEIQEVAEKLNMSKEGVRVINRRALDKLRSEITVKRNII